MELGTIIMLCGLPGAGKTTMAKKLEKGRSAVRFSPDEWILQLLPNNYSFEERDRLRHPVEKLLYETASRIAELGGTAILENGFWTQADRNSYRDKIHANNLRVELYYLDVPLQTLSERLLKRNGMLPEGSFAVSQDELDRWYNQFEPVHEEEAAAYDVFKTI